MHALPRSPAEMHNKNRRLIYDGAAVVLRGRDQKWFYFDINALGACKHTMIQITEAFCFWVKQEPNDHEANLQLSAVHVDRFSIIASYAPLFLKWKEENDSAALH